MIAKPLRENFKSDDDFGEAYAYWMAHRTKAAAPALPIAAPAAPLLPRQSEAEREAWNRSTKVRFLRAKASKPGPKAT